MKCQAWLMHEGHVLIVAMNDQSKVIGYVMVLCEGEFSQGHDLVVEPGNQHALLLLIRTARRVAAQLGSSKLAFWTANDKLARHFIDRGAVIGQTVLAINTKGETY